MTPRDENMRRFRMYFDALQQATSLEEVRSIIAANRAERNAHERSSPPALYLPLFATWWSRVLVRAIALLKRTP